MLPSDSLDLLRKWWKERPTCQDIVMPRPVPVLFPGYAVTDSQVGLVCPVSRSSMPRRYQVLRFDFQPQRPFHATDHELHQSFILMASTQT
jgi:hypothetical protein